MTGRWLVILVILAVGFGMLELMLRQMKIGDYAQSPQHFEISQGMTVLAGGGRAGVTFLDAPFLRSAVLHIRCKDLEKRVQLKPGSISEELCDVRVKLLNLVPGGKVAVEVTWGPRTQQNETDSDNLKVPTGDPETHD